MSKKIYNQDKMYAGNFSLNFFDGLSIGSISTYAGDDTPDGCLVCDGSAVLRTTYGELFAVIGTKFGAGDGTSTFNLPNIIDPTTPTLKHLIKAKSGNKSINNATNTNRGFIRLATDDEAENSVLEDVAINPKQLKLALPKTSLRSKIYGTDDSGKQCILVWFIIRNPSATPQKRRNPNPIPRKRRYKNNDFVAGWPSGYWEEWARMASFCLSKQPLVVTNLFTRSLINKAIACTWTS